MPYLATLCSKKTWKISSLQSTVLKYERTDLKLIQGKKWINSNEFYPLECWAWEWLQKPSVGKSMKLNQAGAKRTSWNIPSWTPWMCFHPLESELFGCWRRKKMKDFESETMIWDEDRGWTASMVMLLWALYSGWEHVTKKNS